MKKNIVFFGAILTILSCVMFAVPSHAVLVVPSFVDFDGWKNFECPFGDCTNHFRNQDVGDEPGDLVISGISFHFYRVEDQMFFDWSSTLGVCALLVKAGGNGNDGRALFYNYKGAGLLPTSDTGLHAPTGPSGKFFDVSNVSGCATPEPSTLLLIGTGLIAITIPGLRKKLKK